MEAEIAGFKRYVREGVTISTNQRVTLDITMELGGTSETVTVSADVPLVNSTTASTGRRARSEDGRVPSDFDGVATGASPVAPLRVRR